MKYFYCIALILVLGFSLGSYYETFTYTKDEDCIVVYNTQCVLDAFCMFSLDYNTSVNVTQKCSIFDFSMFIDNECKDYCGHKVALHVPCKGMHVIDADCATYKINDVNEIKLISNSVFSLCNIIISSVFLLGSLIYFTVKWFKSKQTQNLISGQSNPAVISNIQIV